MAPQDRFRICTLSVNGWPRLDEALLRVPPAPKQAPETLRWEDIVQRFRDFVAEQGTTRPFDYYFLNHTSRLQLEKQSEYQTQTGYHGGPIYNVRVRVESYYDHMLSEVARVRYHLEGWPKPIQDVVDPSSGFLLKELAYGPPMVMAELTLKDDSVIRASRFLTLMRDGPVLPEEFHASYSFGTSVVVVATSNGFIGIVTGANRDSPVWKSSPGLNLEDAKLSALDAAARLVGVPQQEITWEHKTPQFEALS